jgi:hypothetical protein
VLNIVEEGEIEREEEISDLTDVSSSFTSEKPNFGYLDY